MSTSSARKRAVKKPSKNDLNGLQLKTILPKTDAQKDVFDAFSEGYHIFMNGYPGTGKSLLALYLGIKEMFRHPEKYEKVIIIRSAVSSRELGHLPGDQKEKIEVYEEPYIHLCKELFDRGDAYSILKQKDKIQFLSTSFLRGTTLNNAIVIIDEFQNFRKSECVTVFTRMGENTRIFVLGDVDQNDLVVFRNDVSWGYSLIEVISKMESFDIINFELDDIVRSGFVKEFIIAKSELKD